jgi:hypothetical protein
MGTLPFAAALFILKVWPKDLADRMKFLGTPNNAKKKKPNKIYLSDQIEIVRGKEQADRHIFDMIQVQWNLI